MKVILFMIPLIAVISVSGEQDICRVLTLSGGGNGGSYQAGVIHGLAHALDPDQVYWEAVSGVSAGAINTAGISVFAPGDVVEMSEFLVDTWMSLKSEDIWKFWPDGLVDGLKNQKGLLDDSPLLETLQNLLSGFDSIKKKMVVATVNTLDGAYKTYDETTPYEKVAQAVTSSGSIPGAFAPQFFDSGIYMDGGTVWNVNLVDGVKKCREVVDSDEKIVVDIILCFYLPEYDTEWETKNTISNFMRYKDIKEHYKILDDVIDFKQTVPNVNFRYLFTPSEKLESGAKMLVFNEKILGRMVELGKKDTATMLEKNEGFAFNKLEEWQSNSFLHQQFNSFNDYVYAE